jgi:CheY-like chemotaxis protein
MKVLVADDDLIFRSLMVSILADGGHEPQEAENGLAAWDLIGAEAPDLAVLDVNMPEMDGVELMKLLRADDRFKALPVLILTIGFVAEELVAQFDPAFTDYLTKPFETGALLEKIGEMESRMIKKPAPGN